MNIISNHGYSQFYQWIASHQLPSDTKQYSLITGVSGHKLNSKLTNQPQFTFIIRYSDAWGDLQYNPKNVWLHLDGLFYEVSIFKQ